MSMIIAREAELATFEQVLQQKEAAFIALYGRRRVGKTYLVEQYWANKGIFFQLLGLEKAELKVQLLNFASEYADIFGDGEIHKVPKTWFEAFQMLRRKIQEYANQQKKIILFFDELPWLATPRSGFLQALEHCWNRYLSKISNVRLIVCGSAASWMIKHIVSSKGGLHGRVDVKINLKPFTLQETELFLQSRNIHLNRKQIVDLYMAVGGIAQYLKYIKRGYSSEQNINDLCFNSNGKLYNEFNELFRSLFKHFENHVLVVRLLAQYRSGLAHKEVSELSNIPSGGGLTTVLEELEAAGFILSHQVLSDSTKKVKYRLIDEYTLFYLTWCEKYKELGIIDEDPEYWMKQHNSAAWRAWSGYSFEGICVKHLINIKTALGIAGVQTYSAKWYYRPNNKNHDGCEIDLLIDRADQCINLCQIKYYDSEFVIDKSYANKLRKQKQIFIEQTKTKKAIFTTLITTYGAKKNEYYLELIDKEIVLDDLF